MYDSSHDFGEAAAGEGRDEVVVTGNGRALETRATGRSKRPERGEWRRLAPLMLPTLMLQKRLTVVLGSTVIFTRRMADSSSKRLA